MQTPLVFAYNAPGKPEDSSVNAELLPDVLEKLNWDGGRSQIDEVVENLKKQPTATDASSEDSSSSDIQVE